MSAEEHVTGAWWLITYVRSAWTHDAQLKSPFPRNAVTALNPVNWLLNEEVEAEEHGEYIAFIGALPITAVQAVLLARPAA